ncbi:MAG: type II toxin-antitoxin system HicA family toxin [Candidatus Methanolliviera hydrocarbonicum]|uniref:Type II toxin-antitoxin system HicA family toxin n=1 Tax=Candidatus Methanolliviera hydrocarbonicum TaxID=2491085 RepID=A0A520KUD7_9EURY|nr:MAG: type II toxin-antitoxin system HicA family toxin [Candidatus Methanolliviera hydrocarbonicum]
MSNISGRTAIKIFSKFGYMLDHQTGSHMILYHESRPTLSVPDHRELAPGLLRGLIRKAGLTVDEFLEKKQGKK